MKTKSMFLAVTGLVVAAAVSAQPTPVPPEQDSRMNQHGVKMDKDGDGTINREEASGKERLSAHFDAIDNNKDGKLSREELQKFHTAAREKHKGAFEQRFKEADKDSDGMLSKAEAEDAKMPGMVAHFEKADANRDGKISKDELRARRKHMHEQQASRFKSADKDGDGALTKAEAEAGKLPKLVERFDQLDTNKDGKIGSDEIHTKKAKPQPKAI